MLVLKACLEVKESLELLGKRARLVRKVLLVHPSRVTRAMPWLVRKDLKATR